MAENIIRIAIMGYGNLGKGVESAISKTSDTELVCVFTRRDPSTVKTLTGVKVLPCDSVAAMKDDIDVLILCGGSATDLPVQTPEYAKLFNVIDSFDTHADIPVHFDEVDRAAKAAGKTAVISVGWDPGLFSVSRIYGESILPDASTYTFWGKGVSQGHSDAVRRIEGVIDARQYTIPVKEAVDAVKSGEMPELTTAQKHKRECFVVAAPDADKSAIEHSIKTMPKYFDEYETTVHFISAEEMKKNHSALPHGGSVFCSGKTGIDGKNTEVIEYTLRLDSNPEFTSSVLVAYARAAYRLNKEGSTGCKTVFDIAPAYLSPESPEYLRSHLL